MIKRIRFAMPGSALTPAKFADAPPDVRPLRIAVCTALPDLTPDPKHDGIAFEWFADTGHLERYEAWLGEEVDVAACPVIVAEELVLRGADWLEQRWRSGGPRFKHMAIAVRAAHLSAAEFSEQWKHHAGQVGGSGAPAVAIPTEARGLAYVQDHPCPRPEGEWAYDALNEVWFDDVAGLRTRIDWFRENQVGGGDGLFRQSWFIAAREELIG
jgi:hypothetical protein